MLSLVTVSPVMTAFHSCCLSHHVFWPSKPLAGLGRNWNRYILTMLTWNHRDSTPLSAAPRAPNGYKTQHSLSAVAVNHLKKARGEIWPKRSEEETTQKTTKMRTKSSQRINLKKKINSQIKKPHLKMIPIKDNRIYVTCVYRERFRVIRKKKMMVQ